LAEQYRTTIAKLLDRVFAELEVEFEFDDGGISRELRGQVVRKALMAVSPESADRFAKLTTAAGKNGAPSD
jgi:hypothetical protein